MKGFPMNSSVAEMIDRGIEKWGNRGEGELRPRRKRENTNPFHFRASEIGRCMARLSYDWKSEKEKFSVPSLHRMYSGEVWGRELTDLLIAGSDEEIKRVDSEVYISKTLKIGRRSTIEIDGHCDIVITFKNEKKLPIEIKSMGQMSYTELMRDGKPYDEHDAQIRTYMALLGVNEGILLARRMDGPMQEFIIRHDETKWREILARCLEVGLARERGKIAPREYQPGEPPCTFCPFEKQCWGANYSTTAESGKQKPIVIPLRGNLLRLYELAKRKKKLEDEVREIKGKFRNLGEDILQQYKTNVIDAQDRDGQCHRVRKTFVSRTTESVPDEFKEKLRRKRMLLSKVNDYSYIAMKV